MVNTFKYIEFIKFGLCREIFGFFFNKLNLTSWCDNRRNTKGKKMHPKSWICFNIHSYGKLVSQCYWEES